MLREKDQDGVVEAANWGDGVCGIGGGEPEDSSRVEFGVFQRLRIVGWKCHGTGACCGGNLIEF